jgi:hypothetical protein
MNTNTINILLVIWGIMPAVMLLLGYWLRGKVEGNKCRDADAPSFNAE